MKATLFIYTCFCAVLFFTSCKQEAEVEKTAIAKVGEVYLYQEDIDGLLPNESTKEDSVSIVNNYINNWVRQQLLLQKAELNLPDEKKDVEKQLENYRHSLLTFAYEKEFVRQKLDTNVTNSQIKEYYNTHQHEFQLKDYIVKVLYVKIAKDAPKIAKAKKWAQSKEEEDMKKLEDYSRKYATNFFMETNSWLYLDDLLKEVPIKTYNVEQFLKSNKFVELEDESSIYFLRIEDYLLKDSASPLSLERSKIKNIILNERKLALINKMKEDLYKDAVANNKFEIFVQ